MENLEKFKEKFCTHVCRAKRLDNGEWVYGNLILSGDADEGWEAIIVPVINSRIFHNPDFGDLGFGTWFQVDPETICHCVGKVCNEYIWENDIVCGSDYKNGQKYKHVGQVNYVGRAYVVVGINQYEGRHEELTGLYNVIGNIFDNPELL